MWFTSYLQSRSVEQVVGCGFAGVAYDINGGVQKVCTRNVTSLRHSSSCNTIVTNVEVQDTEFLDTPILTVVVVLSPGISAAGSAGRYWQ